MRFTYQEKPLILSRSAMYELTKHGCDLYDVIEILEHGYDCSRSRRSIDIIERCVGNKGKVSRVVIVRSYNYSTDEEVWVVTHFGITSKPRC